MQRKVRSTSPFQEKYSLDLVLRSIWQESIALYLEKGSKVLKFPITILRNFKLDV